MRAQMFGMALRGGRSHAFPTISDATLDDVSASPASSTASLALGNTGAITYTPGSSGLWLIGSTAGSEYEARATLVSGTLSSGTTGSWLSLGTSRTWRLTRSSLGNSSCVFDLEIGLAGANTALDTARITLNVEVSL